MRLDRLSLRQRQLVFAVAAVALTAFVVTAFATARPGQREAPAAGPELSMRDALIRSSTTVAPPVPSSSPDAGVTEGVPSGGAAGPDAAGVEAAKQVARTFVEGYASYRYDEDPAAEAASLRPLVTERLALELAAGSGAGAARQRMVDDRVAAVATVEAVQTQAVEAHAVELLVIARQDVERSGAREQRRPTYLLSVVRTGAGWSVDAVSA